MGNIISYPINQTLLYLDSFKSLPLQWVKYHWNIFGVHSQAIFTTNLCQENISCYKSSFFSHQKPKLHWQISKFSLYCIQTHFKNLIKLVIQRNEIFFECKQYFYLQTWTYYTAVYSMSSEYDVCSFSIFLSDVIVLDL